MDEPFAAFALVEGPGRAVGFDAGEGGRVEVVAWPAVVALRAAQVAGDPPGVLGPRVPARRSAQPRTPRPAGRPSGRRPRPWDWRASGPPSAAVPCSRAGTCSARPRLPRGGLWGLVAADQDHCAAGGVSKARMGHDSERAAISYQHEARRADLGITSAIDAHIETTTASQGQPSDGSPEAQLKAGNGPLMAHGDQQEANELENHVPHALTFGFVVERVTRIELVLSAWEGQQLRLLGALNRRPWRSRVTLVNGPLMARRRCLFVGLSKRGEV